MNKALLEARKKFAGQKAKLEGAGGFDNSPVPEGKYTCNIIKADVVSREDRQTGEDVPRLVFCLDIVNGTLKGRKLWPFPPTLSDLEGITSSASTLRLILGDGSKVSVPGAVRSGGEFELDVDKFLLGVEDLAHACIDCMVEAQVKNSKKKREDGTYFQNIYINRALGLDSAGVTEEDSTDELLFDKPKRTGAPVKKTAKKTVKKAVKKK